MSDSKKKRHFSHGLYPGSFDPVTYAHINIISRFAGIFEHVTVLVASSIHKKYWFSLEERTQMAKEALKELPNVTVDQHAGLTTDYLKKHNIFTVLRGIRSMADFPYERGLAVNNKKIFSGMETLFLFSEARTELISTKWIKEIAFHKGDLTNLVTPFVQKKIEQRVLKEKPQKIKQEDSQNIILEFFNAHPNQSFTAMQVSQKTGVEPGHNYWGTHGILTKLAKEGKLEKLEHGKGFKLLPHNKD